MRGMRYLGGLAVLCSALAAWAWAQTGSGTLPPTTTETSSETVLPGAVTPGATPGTGAPGTPGMSSAPVAPPAMTPEQTAPVMNERPPAMERPEHPVPMERAPVMEKVSARAPVPAPAEGGVEESEPGVNKDNPLGRQEPAVSLEWVGPPVLRIGRAADYNVVVRNVCNIPVQQVMVRVRIPNGMTVKATEPNAIAEGNVLMWEMGTMAPKQEKNLQLKLVPDGKGNVRCQAWVTFTGSSVMTSKVVEPKLMLKAQAPEKVMMGDAATFVLTVTNPGDGAAEQVKIHAELSEGLETVRGKKVDFEIGTLNAGETRSVQLICATKAGGIQFCDAVAEADGDLRAQDKASVNVIMPRLELVMEGPHLKYLGRKANYTLKVTNPGDAPAGQVSVHDIIPAGFKFVSATDGGRHDFSTRKVTWIVGDLAPAQTKEVKLECEAVNPGEWIHNASAQGARGLKAETDVKTRVEGLSAILLEVVDTEDPIEVGTDTSYEIRITNTGSKTETNLKLSCVLPEQMQFKAGQGPVKYAEHGREITFEPIAKLAPRADAIFRITVKGIAPANVRFKAQITSDTLIEPVVEMEATRIYDDSSSGGANSGGAPAVPVTPNQQ
jgi:uncharacterized repeat protein (TIGR01451 family)